MELKELTLLYEKTIERIEKKAYSLTELKDIYDLFRLKPKTENWYTANEVVQKLMGRLEKKVKNIDTENIRNKIADLEKSYAYRYIKYNEEIKKYWNYMSIIKLEVRPALDKTDNRGKQLSFTTLSQIIILAVWIGRLQDNIINFFSNDKRERKDIPRYVNAILYIEKHVPEGLIDCGILQNREEVAEILIKRIEDRISRYGPIRFMDYILNEYKESFNPNFKLLKPEEKDTRKYLYHLGLKLVTEDGLYISKGADSLIGAIEKLTKVLLDLYDYHLNQFSLIFLNNNPIEYFQKAVYYDALYKDIQYPPDSTLIMLDEILESFQQEIIKVIEIDKTTIVTISREIMNIALEQTKSPNPLTSLKKDEVLHRLKGRVTTDQIEKYFLKMTTNQPLNVDYDHPLNAHKITDDTEWLIAIPDTQDEYFMPIPSINCLGLYEKIKGLLGHPNALGNAFERFIRKWLFEQLGAEVYSGKYVYDGRIGETDGIIIIDETVILLESKIKSLTRKARGGHIGHLLMDLGASFIESQKQAFRTEAALRTGPLSLYSEECKDNDIIRGNCHPVATITVPDNQNYLRISCSPFHYGTFAENIVMNNTLIALANYNFETDDVELKGRFEKFKSSRRDLLEMISKVQGIVESETEKAYRNLVFHSYFYSFGILFLLTSKSTSSKSPFERLKSAGYIQSSNYDSYAILQHIL